MRGKAQLVLVIYRSLSCCCSVNDRGTIQDENRNSESRGRIWLLQEIGGGCSHCLSRKREIMRFTFLVFFPRRYWVFQIVRMQFHAVFTAIWKRDTPLMPHFGWMRHRSRKQTTWRRNNLIYFFSCSSSIRNLTSSLRAPSSCLIAELTPPKLCSLTRNIKGKWRNLFGVNCFESVLIYRAP